MVGRIRTLAAAAPVAVADAWWHGGMPGPLWWRTRSASGGQMSEQATHLADLLRVRLGESVEVSAYAASGFIRDIPDFTVDVTVTATVRFACGAIATIHTSCVAQPGQEIDSIGIALRGRGWQAQLTGWGLDAEIRQAGGATETLGGKADVHIRQALAFCAAVGSGDASLLPCSVAEGVQTWRLTRAIDRAAASGQAQRV